MTWNRHALQAKKTEGQQGQQKQQGDQRAYSNSSQEKHWGHPNRWIQEQAVHPSQREASKPLQQAWQKEQEEPLQQA